MPPPAWATRAFRDESRPLLRQTQIDANIAGICRTFAGYVELAAGGGLRLDGSKAQWQVSLDKKRHVLIVLR